MRVELQRLLGGSGDAYVTGIDVRKGDPVALARITATEAVATSASGAIATLSGLITASFGTQSAFISQTQVAVARVDALASAWVFRQVAGAAAGTAEAVAFSNPDGTALSTFSLHYDYIDLDGQVGARDLVISDSTNLVPDEQMQTRAVWNPSGLAEFTLIPTAVFASALSIGYLRWNNPGATTGSAVLAAGAFFPVRAGDVLACSFRMRNFAATGQYFGYAQLQFIDQDGASISTPALYNPGTPITHGNNVSAPALPITAPAGAVKARWRWVVDRAQTTAPTLYFSAPVVRRQTQTVEIADGAITAAKANFTDLGALVATLGTCTITSSLNFADGVVLTGALADFAVSRTAWAQAATRASTIRGNWEPVLSVVMTRRAGTPLLIVAAFGWQGAGGSSNRVSMRLKRGATVLNSFSEERPARDGGASFHQWVDSASVSGAQTYSIECFVPSGYPSGFGYEDPALYLQELAK